MIERVAVVCFYPFPEGMAATNRIIAYSKGMVANGARVDLFLMNPSDHKGASRYPNEGVYEGINYAYPGGRIRSKNVFLHAIEVVYGVLATILSIRGKHAQFRYEALIVSSDIPAVLFFFSRFSALIGLKPIFIFDEYPTPIRRYLQAAIPRWKHLAYSLSLKEFAGYIAMTTNLADFFCRIRSKPYLVMTTVVDLMRFNGCERPSEADLRKKIVYMGNMELAKDNVDNIIRAFSYIASDFVDVDLCLYGRPSVTDRDLLTALVRDLHLDKRVFWGVSSYSEVPALLSAAHILVSSQPKTKRAEGGFPTKLGEYLATGIPVLLTRVGDIATHVSDGEHLFLAKPEDPEDFASKLRYILENYSLAATIGKAGKMFVAENYSNVIQGRKMLEFIAKLNASMGA